MFKVLWLQGNNPFLSETTFDDFDSALAWYNLKVRYCMQACIMQGKDVLKMYVY